ncbi:hypothetical protein FOZ63_016193, partial [Perkinsus olseni]
SFGCGGGYPRAAWTWLHDAGIATGGDNVTRHDMTEADGCWPYDFAPCAHHVKSTKYPSCQGESHSTPGCAQLCHNGKYPISLEEDRHFMAEESPHQYSGVNDAKISIQTDGPVRRDPYPF